MDSKQPTREQVYVEALFLVMDHCLKQLGHKKAPPCVDDADLIARSLVAKFDAFTGEQP